MFNKEINMSEVTPDKPLFTIVDDLENVRLIPNGFEIDRVRAYGSFLFIRVDQKESLINLQAFFDYNLEGSKVVLEQVQFVKNGVAVETDDIDYDNYEDQVFEPYWTYATFIDYSHSLYIDLSITDEYDLISSLLYHRDLDLLSKEDADKLEELNGDYRELTKLSEEETKTYQDYQVWLKIFLWIPAPNSV